MKRNSTQVICLLLSLPCASYGCFAEFVKQVRPSRLLFNRVVARSMSKLPDEQRTRYQDLLATLEFDYKTQKKALSENQCQTVASFHELQEQTRKQSGQERLSFLENYKQHIEKILQQDTETNQKD